MQSILLGLFVVATACAALGLLGRFRLLSRLRNTHSTEWEELGRPKLFGPFSETIAILRFIYSGRIRKINDPVLTRAALVEKIAIGIVLPCTVAYVVLFFAARLGC